MLATVNAPSQPEFLPMAKTPQTKKIVIPSESSRISEVQEEIIKQAQKYGYDKKNLFSVRLALEEALANAIHHGNKNIDQASVTVEFEVCEGKIAICITDQGEGFDKDDLPDPTLEVNLSKPSGRGILLMRTYMDEVTFNESGNEVTMIKKFNK